MLNSDFQISELQNSEFFNHIFKSEKQQVQMKTLSDENDDIKWFDDLINNLNTTLIVDNDDDEEVDEKWFDNLLKEDNSDSNQVYKSQSLMCFDRKISDFDDTFSNSHDKSMPISNLLPQYNRIITYIS